MVVEPPGLQWQVASDVYRRTYAIIHSTLSELAVSAHTRRWSSTHQRACISDMGIMAPRGWIYLLTAAKKWVP